MTNRLVRDQRPGRPRVKICGITSAPDARRAVALGAELIGLNFYAPSPRFIDPERAAELVRTLEDEGSDVTWVGVFVNETIERATGIADTVGLDLLQFHGDETPAQIAPLAERSIKALRVRGDLSPELLDPWRALGLWGLLIDAKHETLYGGSGRRWNVESLPSALGVGDGELRVLVAGGLEPSNVAAASRAARPWGLDLCSGVEAAPGRKDPRLLESLFAELRDLDAERASQSSMPPTSYRSQTPSSSHTQDEEIDHGQTPSAA